MRSSSVDATVADGLLGLATMTIFAPGPPSSSGSSQRRPTWRYGTVENRAPCNVASVS